MGRVLNIIIIANQTQSPNTQRIFLFIFIVYAGAEAKKEIILHDYFGRWWPSATQMGDIYALCVSFIVGDGGVWRRNISGYVNFLCFCDGCIFVMVFGVMVCYAVGWID